ncbi:LuxR family transcriptional regulator [Leucobacter chromiireducens subsp. solipictus]|uniref:LuxR family transcriptional regulator n=4 Tax=Leucobacter TaxID=55968 RepID=A0ABS1SGG3_9MICO|nr:LuxR family transcriptional regulator [Leucobacter chromiireducens subsp. solipictus]
MSVEGSESASLANGRGLAWALEPALHSCDWDKVAELLVDAPLSLVHDSGGLSLMQRTLEQMPREFRDARPDLRFHLELTGLAPISDFQFEAARYSAARTPMSRAALVRRVTLAVIARRLDGLVDEALELVGDSEAWVLAEASRIGSAAEKAASAYFAQAAKTHLLAGNLAKALEAYLQAWRWRHQDELGVIAHEAAGNIGLIHALMGRLEQGKEWLTRSRAWPSSISPDYSPVVQFAAPLAEFIIATEELDLLRARTLLQDLAQPTHGFEFYHLIVEARVKFLLLSGQPLQAQQQIAEASSWLPQDVLKRLNVEALISLGDIEEASGQLDSIHDTAFVQLFRARIASLSGDYQHSLDELAAGAIKAEDRAKLDYLALEASCQLVLGRRIEAKETFEELLNRFNGCISVFASAPSDAARALFDLVPESPCTDAIYEKWRSSGVGPQFNFPQGDDKAPLVGLTSRELVILKQLLRGSSRKEVAARESVSLNTVKSQSRSAFRKLSVSSIQEARTKSIALGII